MVGGQYGARAYIKTKDCVCLKMPIAICHIEIGTSSQPHP